MTCKENLGAVFDCNVFLQATRNANGPAAKALRLLETGAFSLFVSSPILEEVKQTLSDPKYVNLALAAGAKYLVTRDQDLLDLMKDEAFYKQYPQLTILDSVAFLRELARSCHTAKAVTCVF